MFPRSRNPPTRTRRSFCSPRSRLPEQDGLRFAFSHDGYNWSNVPGLFLKAHVDKGIMRDPSICRGPDGTWHLAWTSAWRGNNGFGYAHSKDLVHWSEQNSSPPWPMNRPSAMFGRRSCFTMRRRSSSSSAGPRRFRDASPIAWSPPPTIIGCITPRQETSRRSRRRSCSSIPASA